MSIYDRLCGRDESGFSDENLNKIAIDHFSAMLIEYTFDAVSRQSIIDEFNLNVAEQAELDFILSKGTNQAQRRELYTRIRSMLHLAEGGLSGYGLPSQLSAHIAGI